MCMFCAAIPVAVSAGLVSKAKLREKTGQAVKLGLPQPRHLPIMPLTTVAIVGLMAGSVVYHTTIAPRVGFW